MRKITKYRVYLLSCTRRTVAVKQCPGDAGFICDKGNVLRVMIKRTLRSTVIVNKLARKAPGTTDRLRTHVRTAASPTAKSLRTYRNNSPEGYKRRGLGVWLWENRKTKMCGSVNRTTKLCGSGRTGKQGVWFWENKKPRRVALGEQDNQAVWLWANRKTRRVVLEEMENKACGSGRTGQPSCVALGEQENQGV